MFTALVAFIIGAWFVLAIMLVGVLTRAVALTVLWGWFVQPTFGLEPLSLPMAGGLVLIVYLLMSTKNQMVKLRESRRSDDDEDKSTLGQTAQTMGFVLLYEVGTPASCLALGWVFKQVVG
jgi:hypothetical protein